MKFALTVLIPLLVMSGTAHAFNDPDSNDPDVKAERDRVEAIHKRWREKHKLARQAERERDHEFFKDRELPEGHVIEDDKPMSKAKRACLDQVKEYGRMPGARPDIGLNMATRCLDK